MILNLIHWAYKFLKIKYLTEPLITSFMNIADAKLRSSICENYSICCINVCCLILFHYSIIPYSVCFDRNDVDVCAMMWKMHWYNLESYLSSPLAGDKKIHHFSQKYLKLIYRMHLLKLIIWANFCACKIKKESFSQTTFLTLTLDNIIFYVPTTSLHKQCLIN